MPEDHTSAGEPVHTLAKMPTGAKLFLILSAALLPLALIAVFAALQTTRTADLENRAALSVAAGEAGRTLAIELIGDSNSLRSALAAIDAGADNQQNCARLSGMFAPGLASGVRFALVDAGGKLRCGGEIDPGEALPPRDRIGVHLVEGDGLLLNIAGRKGRARATAFFPIAFLVRTARPSTFLPDYASWLKHDDDRLTLREHGDTPFTRYDRARVPIGIDGLFYEMQTARAPITSAVLVAMALPVLMWLAAVGISWFVVDRLMIRPLRRLRRRVDAYQPGALFEVEGIGAASAQEIRDLGETFAALSRTIATHEDELAQGLVRQTKLTREVHHRVKNNLQVIASLINLHSRSAPTPEAVSAYAAIQRRVDALAVVHRHHFAELEDNRGLGLRSVVSELAANIRGGEGGRDLGITLEIAPYLVSQDSAVAVTFLITEIVELAMSVNATAQIAIRLRPGETDNRALLRISSPALIESERLRALLAERYGRVMEGLSRQLRSKLIHEPLVGTFEIAIAVMGRD